MKLFLAYVIFTLMTLNSYANENPFAKYLGTYSVTSPGTVLPDGFGMKIMNSEPTNPDEIILFTWHNTFSGGQELYPWGNADGHGMGSQSFVSEKNGVTEYDEQNINPLYSMTNIKILKNKDGSLTLRKVTTCHYRNQKEYFEYSSHCETDRVFILKMVL